ncbi:nck-associated protein 1 homolog [Rhopilema esculentum]|uniref:nck-associated protein 1 homolog n=1 Tax=Rhopilema esculentum TaxID=499914 RepID=UPI0031D7CAA1
MDRSVTVAEQKLAEKLVILNRRGRGMLTRIFNIKKACSDAKSRPAFLGEKSLEGAIKIILKKFPNLENTRGANMQPVFQMHADIVRGLTNYYYTFIDVMDFKDHVGELLTSIDASFVNFDITLNFHLTKAYLDLIVTYATLFIMVSRVEDRKTVLSLFNHAYDIQKGHGESGFPRLGQMILDYEVPFKKLMEEFTPHAQRVGIALQSVHELYRRRNLPGDQMRQGQHLSLTSMPQNMLNPSQSEMVQCEYLSIEEMAKWILFGYMLCPSQLTAQPGALDIWKLALQDGYCVMLFRDEVMMVHKEFTTVFDGMKGKENSKRKRDIEESLNYAMTNSAAFHRDRRQYLRMAIEELNEILGDQPGLLGPKALLALLALSLGKDEIHWLLRHHCNPPPRGRKVNLDEYSDSQLPRLLHGIVGLRDLFFRYSQVIQRYFAQYLSGFDVAVLKEVIQKLSVCSEDESLIMTSFVEILSSIDVDQATTDESVDLRGVRLDWMRLQAYTSVRGVVPELKDMRDLATLMNTIVLHTNLVDSQAEILNEVSDLSLFCFYPSFFENTFVSCLENPRQRRFAIAYPMICTQFLNCCDPLCPEERHPIGDRSLSAVNSFLNAMTFKATHFIGQLCEDQLHLAKQLWAGNSVASYVVDEPVKTKKDKPRPPMRKPGEESRRKSVEDVKAIEDKLQGQKDLLISLSHTKEIMVWEHTFTPKEYLVSHLEEFFTKTVTKLANYSEATQEIARPSLLLRDVKVYMSTFYRVEESVNVDMGRIFNATLLQQTQSTDNSGGPTLTSTYTTWYIDVFLKRVTGDSGIIYSPARQAFVSRSRSNLKAENYTDVTEMRSLAELLGPYGVRYFCRKMMSQVVAQVDELKNLVLINKDALVVLKDNFNKPALCVEYIKRLRNVDDVLARTTIIGVLLCFRSLLATGLKDVLDNRASFLMKVLRDFKENNPRDEMTVTHEMIQAAGHDGNFDADLFHALRSARDKSEEDSSVWDLLLVFWATTIPTLAYKDTTEYIPALEGHFNNAHCMAKAVNAVSKAIFTITEMDSKEKMKDFLAVASCSLLRLGMDPPSKELIPKQRESTYILLDLIVQESSDLSDDVLDLCFPYALMREAYQIIYKKQRVYTGLYANVKSDQEQN